MQALPDLLGDLLRQAFSSLPGAPQVDGPLVLATQDPTFGDYQSNAAFRLTRALRQPPLRIAQEERLRLGGLVWPEARQRLAGSAWLTVERLGKGQVILFAATPAFRGYHLATGRLFANAVVYGPGMGAAQPIGW